MELFYLLYDHTSLFVAFIPLVAIILIVIRFLVKYKRARAYRETYEAKKYVGKAMRSFDPITGAPINVTGNPAVIAYYEDHFDEKLNDELEEIGKNRDDY